MTSADDAACYARTAAAKRRRRIAVIIAAGVDDQRMAAQFVDGVEARRDQHLRRRAIGPDMQHRQIAEVTSAARTFVMAAAGGVEVSASAASRGHFALGVRHRRA